jgi:hypothetical protein
VRTAGTQSPLVPIGRITFDPQTRYYGFSFHFEGLRVHHKIDTFETLEHAMRWADPWGERIWEEPSNADEIAVLVSRRKKAA